MDPATWQRVAQLHPVGVPVAAGPATSSPAVRVLSTLAFVVGLLAVCAGATVIPWMAGLRDTVPTVAAGDVPLHDATVTAADRGESGRPYDSTLNGARFVNATGFWVGCDGRSSSVAFALDGRFKRFTGTAGLDAATPKDIVVKLAFALDGKTPVNVSVSRDMSEPVELDVTSARTLTLSAQRTKGTCGNATRPYGAIGDALLRQS